MYKYKTSLILSLIFLVFIGFQTIYAEDMTSTSFTIRDPHIGTGGGYGTSENFKIISAGNILLSGIGSSQSFIGHNGFLYYPKVTDVELSVVQNTSNADLSWPAAVSTEGLGWAVSGYKTGISQVSGGPYTYTNVGNTTNYSYIDLTPGYYCFVLQTLDGLGYVIKTSNEVCLNISPILTFIISGASLDFGRLTSSGPRYANNSGGAISDTVAHTMSASSNAVTGYTISYKGETLSSGINTIDPATNVNGDGTPGTEQFGLSLFTNGTATISSSYDQGGPTRSFNPNTTTAVASTNGPTSTETFNNHYLANISSTTPNGKYTTDLIFVITGNF